MALQKSHQLTQDIDLPDAYFRVVQVTPNLQSDTMRHMTIKLRGYYNKTARDNDPLDFFYEEDFLIDSGNYDSWFEENKNHIEIAYEYLKTLDEFSNAQDVI